MSGFGASSLFSQTGTLQGTIKESVKGIPIERAAVKFNTGTTTLGALTDEKGEYSVKAIPPGKYTVEVYMVGYNKLITENVTISNGSITFFDASLAPSVLGEIVITHSTMKEDLLGTGGISTMTRIPAEVITGLAGGRGIDQAMIALVPRLTQASEKAGINFSGSRTGSTVYFIDGVKVIGDPQIPQRGIEEMVVITGGIPAQYGDTTSGVVLITTKSYRAPVNPDYVSYSE